MGSAPASAGRSPGSAFSLSVNEGVAHLLVDVPGEKVNILSSSVMTELGRILADLNTRTNVRCLVVRSRKPAGFIAGADLHELASVTDRKTAMEKAGNGQEVFNALADLPFPTIAVIHGAAVGGGLELALACDYRVVTDDPRTKLSLPETTIGIVPGFGGTFRLPRRVGLTQALRMILSGAPVDGRRAEKIGLADACWPAAFLNDKLGQLVTALSGGGGFPGPSSRKKRLLTALAEGTPIGRAFLFRAARRDIISRSAGHYPAPLEALAVLRKTVHAGREKALEMEREAIGRLLPTDITRNMVRLFFAQEAARRAPVPAGEPGRKVARAAVLGAGVMGGRIAWLFARQGIPVVLKDVAWEQIRKGFETARGVWGELEKKRRTTARETNLGMHRLSGAVEYRSLGSPDIVVEAVVENLEVKKKVLAEVEEHVRDTTLIASNTSSLSISEMATGLRVAQRFLGMHFFNPPNRMPLVEVVPGAATSPDAVSAAVRTAILLGKTPIVVRDRPGFLVNRLLMPYLNECVRLAEEGRDYVAVDRALVDFGMPMGPFTLLDEIGLDIAREVGRVLAAVYGARMAGSSLLDSLAGRTDLLGKKSGRGFYLHGKGRRDPNPEMRRLAGPRRQVSLGRGDMVDRPLLAMVNEAALALQEGIVSSAQDLDLALILGIGFPPFLGGLLRWADQRGTVEIRDTLAGFAQRLGDRFTPAPLVTTLAAEGKGFYETP